MGPERRPSFSLAEAEALAARLYGLDARAADLPSERDRNVRLDPRQATGQGATRRYVLKIFHADEEDRLIDAQLQAMARSRTDPEAVTPAPLAALDGTSAPTVTGADGQRHRVCLLPFMPGRPLAHVQPRPDRLLHDLGRRLAQLDHALARPGLTVTRRDFAWDPGSAPATIRRHAGRLTARRREIVERIVEDFERHALPRMDAVRRQPIHGDANDYNVLTDGWRVTAILDFGDIQEAWLPCELAHAAAYMMLASDDPVRSVATLARGYVGLLPLARDELAVVYDLALLRLALSVCLSAHQRFLDPANAYLSISEKPAWCLLERWAVGDVARDALVGELKALADRHDDRDGEPGGPA